MYKRGPTRILLLNLQELSVSSAQALCGYVLRDLKHLAGRQASGQAAYSHQNTPFSLQVSALTRTHLVVLKGALPCQAS